MTLEQVEKRVEELKRELTLLEHEVMRLKGIDVIPGFGMVGRFKDDTDFDEVVRLGREWREEENRKSLEEFDREEAAAAERAKKAASPKKAAKPRKKNARA